MEHESAEPVNSGRVYQVKSGSGDQGRECFCHTNTCE